jgi:hypothetical protein
MSAAGPSKASCQLFCVQRFIWAPGAAVGPATHLLQSLLEGRQACQLGVVGSQLGWQLLGLSQGQQRGEQAGLR